MKKIDFHIHTVPTISDSAFTFSLVKFKEYVKNAKLDAVAITNHDVFDKSQYEVINDALDIKVFPGIEINLEKGHLLLIGDEDILDFSSKCEEVTSKIQQVGDFISVDELKEIFGNLQNYLLIPHYGKNPELSQDTLTKLDSYINSGEVGNQKKFVRNSKDELKLTPLLFSDVRISESLEKYPTRQTYLECGELTLNSIKSCLNDKGKVALSEKDGNSIFQIFDNGQKLSTGLNVILGERSSGKTFTLNMINEDQEDAKYIKQFSLVQQDDGIDEEKFNEYLNDQRSLITEEYLKEFKGVLNEVLDIDLEKNNENLSLYFDSLICSATEAEKKDVFSKCALFDETEFQRTDLNILSDLIGSVRMLIENLGYKDVIEKHIEREVLKRLILELIEIYWEKKFLDKKRKFVSETVREIKKKLKLQTSATQILGFDLYKNKLDSNKVQRFTDIVQDLKKESIIREENIQGYKIVATKRQFSGAGEVKKVSGLRTAFSDVFKEYKIPYKYLKELKYNESLLKSEFYKYFVKIEYQILNKDGFEASGGERSEFRLLQEIHDAQRHGILLIDEPESSFDNIFLRDEVNQIIKDISKQMPVVVVTHNNTVGATIQPDYLIYTRKFNEDGKVKYRTYSGYPGDKVLYSPEGDEINNFEITIDSLEAGGTAYEQRRIQYENLKN